MTNAKTVVPHADIVKILEYRPEAIVELVEKAGLQDVIKVPSLANLVSREFGVSPGNEDLQSLAALYLIDLVGYMGEVLNFTVERDE